MHDESSTSTKVCTKCGVEKPATTEFFHPHKQCRYGVCPDCRECHDAQRADYRAAHRAELAEKQHARYVPVSETRAEHPGRTCEHCGQLIPNDKRIDARFCSARCRERAKCRRHYSLVAADHERLASKRKRERERGASDERRQRACQKVSEWRKTHPERAALAHRRDYERHRDQRIAQCARWHREHPESKRATSSRRRSATGSHNAADIVAQLARQHGKCFWCGARVDSSYHVDHVIPLTLGGSNDLGNIVVACPRCNMSKGAKHPMDWAGRLL